MPEKMLSDEEASALTGTDLPGTNVPLPPLVKGWLAHRNRTDHQLARVAAATNILRVYEVEGNPDAIGVAPGRCTIDGTVYEFVGAEPAVDGLSDNDTTYVWAADDGAGGLQINSDVDGNGWPNTPHIKLAEVTMEDGEITEIVDRRPEHLLSDAAAGFNAHASATSAHGTSGDVVGTSDAQTLTNKTIDADSNTISNIGAAELDAALADGLVQFDLSIATQGDTATPSAIEIQAKDAAGNDLQGTVYLRVRVCDENGYIDASNATIDADGSSTAVETISAGKDLILQSDSNGLIEIELTNASAETVTLRIGPAPLSAPRGDYAPTLSVTHAAP